MMGTAPVPSRTATRQVVAGRYVLEQRLGSGGMGQVYRARHLQLGKLFALKIIAAAFADNEGARARFNQEAKLASEISHPNIVSVVDFGEDPRVGVFMVMELVDGVPLLDNGRPVAIKRALDVLGQLADVLDHIHRRGIIHGDVKAENVLLVTESVGPRRRQIVRLLDFGLAQRHGTHGSELQGTAQYLAPERIAGAPASVASDVYALGVLGYQMLAGAFPFDGPLPAVLLAQVHDDPPPIAAHRGESIDPAIDALIAHAMEKDPAKRHRSAAAFRYELNTVMDMLAMNPRLRKPAVVRNENPRDVTINSLFESSMLPQALLSSHGTIGVANQAFAKLLGEEHANVEGLLVTQTALAGVVPDLMNAVRWVQQHGYPCEYRARIERHGAPSLELVIWLAPFAPDQTHALVRVQELA